MNAEAFRASVRGYLRAGDCNQMELARAIGLHEKVLSRKLNGSQKSALTHRDIHDIAVTLVDWHLITSRDALIDLLTLTEIEPRAIFRDDEWLQSPLNELSGRKRTIQTASAAELMHNLPAQRAQFIGRRWAIERLQQLFRAEATRLVTLVGPGGSGKTALAVHVVHTLVNDFPAGVWFVSLAELSDPALVPISILQTLNVKTTPGESALQSLLTYVRSRQLLLVLDNFEHLGEAGSVIDAMLGVAPQMKIMLTSRVVQRLYGEREFRVPPLDVPDLDMKLATATLAQYEAIQLFVDRAQEVQPEFTLSDENAAIIAQICARLDGLPLALELAAARIKLLPAHLLLERLTRASLPLLTKGSRNLPTRQHTLRNTTHWSYDLLGPDEQRWFRRLGIFIGGWTLETTEVILQDFAPDGEASSLDPLDLLEQLVDSSLVIRLPLEQGQVRFTMLTTLREYALEQLVAHEEDEQLRDWHACYYLRKAEEAELELRGPQQLRYLAQLRANRDNFRSALEWFLQKASAGQSIEARAFAIPKAGPTTREIAGSTSLTAQVHTGERLSALELSLRLAAALRYYWEWSGYLTEGRHWLNAALQLPIDREAAQTVWAARAKALAEGARLVVLQNEQERALELANESATIWQRLNDARGLATALLYRGWATHGGGDYESAKYIYQEAMQVLAPDVDPWLYAQLLLHLGASAGFTSDGEMAEDCYTRSRALFTRIGDRSAVADAWKDQGGILLLQSRWVEAIECLLKSVELCAEMGHKQFLATSRGLFSFAVGLRAEPDPESASLHSAQIKGAADRLMETIGLTPWTRTNPFAQAVRTLIRSRVDEQQWEAAWNAGRDLSLEQAIELVHRLAEYPPGERGSRENPT